MIKRMLLMLIVVGLVIGGIFGFKMYQGMLMQQKMANRQPPPVTVTTTEATTARWQPKLHAVGSLTAVEGVAIQADMAGRVERIGFESGQEVAEGDLLVAQDISTEEAELDRLQAERDLAETQLQRQRELAQRDQTSEAAVDEAEAEVASLEAQIAAKRAVIAKKRIRAPFAGRLGRRQVDRGQVLSPGQELVSLQALAPLFVDFELPQRELNRVAKGMTVAVAVDTYPDRRFEAEIAAVEPKVAQETRNFGVRARLANEDRALRPGMFADVHVELPQRRDRITLPQTAVMSDPYGESVFVVEAGEGDTPTVSKRAVTTGARRGDQVAIADGLEPGETVVTSGQLKLDEGARVQVNNEVLPANDPDPQPANR